MKSKRMRLSSAVAMVMFLIGVMGCSPMNSHQAGIDVMFEDNPQVFKTDVYDHGQIIGHIINQKAGRGSVYKVTLRLLPEYGKNAGKHWVFYADNGTLQAARISASGQPLTTGDKACGFESKTALNWFKLKTLLTDRVYKANQKAETLYRRFG